MADDVFSRIEAHVVALGELLEQTRRYKPLADDAARLYRSATSISRRVRQANRAATGADDDLDAREREMEEIAAQARGLLEGFLASARYEELLDALARDDVDASSALVSELFADIEPATPSGALYLPLSAKRGEGVLAPDAAAEAVERMAREGIAPQHAPGAGADASVQPIRFYEGTAGIDAALLVVVGAQSLGRPAFRARELDEVLVYARRLQVPLSAALHAQSPDDWLELRAGGYGEYREKCRAALAARGIVVVEL